MDTIKLATEALIRLFREEIDAGAVLIAADDLFETTEVPAVLLQGPTLTEDGARRTMATWTQCDIETQTYARGRFPRRYHLDFDVVVSTGTQGALLVLQGAIADLYQRVTQFFVDGIGYLALTEITPVGGLRRVNLSNISQASGRCRIESCPVGDAATLETSNGKLVITPVITVREDGL